jgi:heat-inducible transcriptional repressor
MLSDRQKRILWAIIDDYIISAEPVGSRTVSKKKNVGFSAATIRNEMADLEEMGFLEQPHTSAGRIPSQKGYRFYVDHLLIPTMWTTRDIFMLHQHYTEKIDEIEQTIQHTSSIISDLTHYLTVILGPKLSDNKLKHLQVIPLTNSSAVSILVTDKGQVHQKRVTLPEDVPFSSIERLINLLNHRLKGISLIKLRYIVDRELRVELVKYIDQYGKLIGFLDQMLQTKAEDRVYTSGTTRMLDQPEFRDIDKMKSLLGLIEKSQTIIQLFKSQSQEGVQIRIGTEHHIETVNHCSIITASYMIRGEPVGTIGVIGPIRMNYGKVIGLIDFLAKDISRRLHELYEE